MMGTLAAGSEKIAAGSATDDPMPTLVSQRPLSERDGVPASWRERATVAVLGAAVWAAGLAIDRVLRSAGRTRGDAE